MPDTTGYGHQHFIGFGAETTWGTGVAATAFIEVNSDTLKKEDGYEPKGSLRAISQMSTRRARRKAKVGGALEFQLGFDGYGLLLKHAFGAVATAGGPTYTHDYSFTTALLTGLSVISNRDADAITGSSCHRFTGCQVSKLTFKQSHEDLLMVTAEFVGKDREFMAKPTPTFPTFAPISWDQLVCLVAGSAVSIIDMELTIENALADDRYTMASGLLAGLKRGGPRKVTGKITTEWDSLTRLNLFVNQTSSTLKFTWTGTGSNKFELNMPAVIFEGSDPEVSDAGPITMEMPFTAWASAEGNELTAQMVNTTATPG